MLKTFLTLFVICLFYSGVTSAQETAQPRKTWSWIGDINEIQVSHLASEIESFKKLETIYSKARGVTVLSAINNVNNRALRKLKTEAAMLGADAILITNNYQKGVQFTSPVQVTYTAVAYNSKPISLDQVRNTISGKQYHQNVTARYNRNYFRHNFKFGDNAVFPIDPEMFYEKDGRVMLRSDRNYQVVSMSQDHLALAYYEVPGKILVNIILVSRGMKK